MGGCASTATPGTGAAKVVPDAPVRPYNPKIPDILQVDYIPPSAHAELISHASGAILPSPSPLLPFPMPQSTSSALAILGFPFYLHLNLWRLMRLL